MGVEEEKGEEERKRVQRQVLEDAESRWWEEAVTFPNKVSQPSFSCFPFPSLPYRVCPHLPTHSSLPLSPCLCLRCSVRVTPQHCSVISGPRAASSEPTYWTCRARAGNGPPPAAFLLNRVPSPSANHRPLLCPWQCTCYKLPVLPQTTCRCRFARCCPDHLSQPRRLLKNRRLYGEDPQMPQIQFLKILQESSLLTFRNSIFTKYYLMNSVRYGWKVHSLLRWPLCSSHIPKAWAEYQKLGLGNVLAFLFEQLLKQLVDYENSCRLSSVQ